MTTTLTKDQKSKVSLHGGYVLSTHYPEALPMWKDIGTDVKKTLLKDLVKRLREKECSDVAEYVESYQEEALKLLQIRFKSMKDKRRAKSKKQAMEQEASPADSAATASSATLATSPRSLLE